MVGKRGSLEERFWPKVLKKEPNECWLWQANKNNMGYGMIRFGGKIDKVLAHRVSYFLRNGPISDEICVLHRCDTPACVNPDHLFLGTKKDNNDDMTRKGRRRWGHNPLYPPPIHRGEAANSAKLTEAQVLEIRALMAAGATGPQMAIKFGIARSTANRIKRRFGWKHI
jgi:hypothetical protein